VAVGLLAAVGPAAAQVIEQRSSVRNPDGSTSHSSSRSYSQATYSGESTGPDGVTTGFDLHRDSTGKLRGNEWTAKGNQKLETRKIEGEADGIGGRTALGGFGALGSGLGLGSGNTGFGPGSSSFGNSGFGPGSASFGTPGFGTPGFGSGVGGIGSPGFSGFPNGGLPWANFGNFHSQFGQLGGGGGFGQIPQFNYANFGFQQPLAVPNYSKFLLGGVGSNPNIANDGHFANVVPRIGLSGGFGNVGGGFGAPGYGQRSYKQEVDPSTGSSSYSYSESSGHSTSSRSGH